MLTTEEDDDDADIETLYPGPTIPLPSDGELAEMVFTTVAKATDGCVVELDGRCFHGHASWLLYLGLV